MAVRARMQDEAVARAKREILEDIAEGRVPASVGSFAELHGYVDANEYGGLCDTYAAEDVAFAAAVQEELDGWLRQGRRVEA